jgi:hypothetical protein
VRKGITLNNQYKADNTAGWMVQDLNPVRGKGFSLLQNVQTGTGAHPASYSVGTRVLSWCKSTVFGIGRE